METDPRALPFTKMHGNGNDYVFINCFEHPVDNPAVLSPLVSDRHFGIGADGIILMEPAEDADLGMRIFNADGSEAEMCGNGIRCVAKYAYDHGLAHKDTIAIHTGAGILEVHMQIEDGVAIGSTVNMGIPRLERGAIPMTGPANEQAVNVPLEVDGKTLEVTCVSVGNPHCVLFLEAPVDEFPLENIGPLVEHHVSFPERINFHIVNVLARDDVRMRTWERGSGITLACGTGATAVCVAGAISQRTDRRILAHLPGGDLRLDWVESGSSGSSGHVEMTGPATEAFTGVWLRPS